VAGGTRKGAKAASSYIPAVIEFVAGYPGSKEDMESHTVSRDAQNPDAAERQRPLCHMQFMGNFTPDGHNRYLDGWIYNPRERRHV